VAQLVQYGAFPLHPLPLTAPYPPSGILFLLQLCASVTLGWLRGPTLIAPQLPQQM